MFPPHWPRVLLVLLTSWLMLGVTPADLIGQATAGDSLRTRSGGAAAPSKEETAAPGRSYFVGIGIDQYRETSLWKRLSNAKNDVERVRKVLVDDFRFRAPDEWVLLDSAATKQNIENLLDTLDASLEPNDNLIFFYAGHADTLRDDGYLVPVGANRPISKAESQYLQVEEVLERLAKFERPRHILVILDACHAGIALNVKERRDSVSSGSDPSTMPSRRVIASATKGQQAADFGEEGNSLFTGTLIEAFDRAMGRGRTGERSPDTDADGQLTTGEVFLFVEQEVIGSPMNIGQVPVQGSFADTDGQLVLPLDASPFDAVFREIYAVSQSGTPERFAELAERLVTATVDDPRAAWIAYMLADVKGDTSGKLSALQRLDRYHRQGRNIYPMTEIALTNALRDTTKLCRAEDCEALAMAR